MAAEIPNGIGCWKATRKSCTLAMLADGRCRRPRNAASTGTMAPTRGDPDEAIRREPLRSTRPVRRAPRLVGRRRRGRSLLLAALPLAPQVPGHLSAGGFILDDLESARAKALLETRARRTAVGARHRLQQPDARGRDARVRGGRRGEPCATSRAPRTSPGSSRTSCRHGQVSADRHTAYDVVFLDLPPDDSPEALPILRERLHQAPGLTVELAGGPAFYGDVQTVSEADLQRSEVISLPLAALALLLVFGSVVAAGVPLVSAARRSSSRSPRSSWSRRSRR